MPSTMHRLRFSKKGDAVWISHLDTMRLFQRAFRRAGLTVMHTKGFNPHAFVSIAMPLPVGTESVCELLNFTLKDDTCRLSQIPELLNAALPGGVRVLEAYDNPRKVGALAFLRTEVRLYYDNGIPEHAVSGISALFSRPVLVVMKKSKKGPVETDIRPMIRSIEVFAEDDHTILLNAVVSAQNPSLNPNLLEDAVSSFLPEQAADAFRSRRLEVFDSEGALFR